MTVRAEQKQVGAELQVEVESAAEVDPMTTLAKFPLAKFLHPSDHLDPKVQVLLPMKLLGSNWSQDLVK